MRQKVQEELDRVLVYYDEQLGQKVKAKGAVLLVTEYGLSFELDFDDILPVSESIMGFGISIIAHTIGVGPMIVKSLVHIIDKLEQDKDPDYRVSGFVLVLPAENSENEKVLLIEAHDRDGDKISYSCPVEDVDDENETIRMRSIDLNGQDEGYLKQGLWPWQLN